MARASAWGKSAGMRPIRILSMFALLAACATGPKAPQIAGPAKVNPASIAENPASWDGREVEVVGLLAFEREHYGLYQSYGSYCRGAEKTAIYVIWPKWPGVTRADNRRQVVVRGVFRNLQGVVPVYISNAAAGPGPLEPGSVIRWLSKPAKPCPRALP